MNDVFDDSDDLERQGPDDQGPDDDRTAQVARALLKALAVVVVIGVVIALGTTVMVRALGLNENDSPGPVGVAPSGPTKPLPTTALPVPGDDKSPEPTKSAAPTKTPDKNRDLKLDASPVKARPMERVNLTGTYKGADNLSLKVQRFENGGWSDFGVDATVRVGTYATYVQTGRAGVQRFRMYDPAAKQASNAVRVTIG